LFRGSLLSKRENKAIFVPERAVNYRYGVYKVFVVKAVFTVMLIAFLVTLGLFSYRGLAVDLFPKA
jgi:hypothetical protein